MKNEFGKPIGRDMANTLIEKHKVIKSEVMDFLKFNLEFARKDLAHRHLTKDYNAFIFDKEQVLRFFNIDPSSIPNDSADCLMVILGAHDKTDIIGSLQVQEGEPTVLLAGCKRQSDGSFFTLNIPEPASEHPPQRVIASLPPKEDRLNSNSIKFNLI
jgi:hypothetical protein